MNELSPHEKDHQLVMAYKTSPNKETFNALYDHMKPFMQKAIKKHKASSGLPHSAFDIQAANQLFQTANNFDPHRGVQFTTKLYADLQSVSRLNYAYQNLARIPENRASKVGNLIVTRDYLKSQLGRDPSDGEIADAMSVPVKHVSLMQRELRSDLLEGKTEGLEHAYMNYEDVDDLKQAEIIYFELNATEQVVFDYLTGLHGKPRLTKGNKPDWVAISKKAGVTELQARTIKERIARRWKRLQT